jgi:hypothetical protein
MLHIVPPESAAAPDEMTGPDRETRPGVKSAAAPEPAVDSSAAVAAAKPTSAMTPTAMTTSAVAAATGINDRHTRSQYQCGSSKSRNPLEHVVLPDGPIATKASRRECAMNE